MKILKTITAVVAALALSGPVAAQDDDPNRVIESAAELLATALGERRDELEADRDELYAVIDDILLPRFDRRFAAQVVLAKHWRTANAEQRDRFIQAFYRSLLQRYADGVLEYQQERVKVLPYRGDASKPRTKVRSTVELNDGTSVAVDYDLVKRDSGWLIFNVVIEGVSYVRNYRTELDSEIRGSSLEAVISRLESETGLAGGG